MTLVLKELLSEKAGSAAELHNKLTVLAGALTTISDPAYLPERQVCIRA